MTMFNGLNFLSQQKNGLTYWVCLKDNKIIAQAWSLVGVRSQVLSLLRNHKWSA